MHRRTHEATHDFALVAQLRQQFFDGVGRDGKADADIAAGLAKDRGVDAHDFAAQIEQRAARVTWIDRSISLNKVVVRPLADIAPLGADDTGSNRMVEAERIADRHDPLADFEPVRVAQS